jgi:hypothetical protein
VEGSSGSNALPHVVRFVVGEVRDR